MIEDFCCNYYYSNLAYSYISFELDLRLGGTLQLLESYISLNTADHFGESADC